MNSRQQKKIERAVVACIDLITKARLSREELVVVLGQMLIRSGYSIHWGYENPGIEKPEKISKDMAEDLYISNPTTGTTLMKIGFDLQDVLLLRTER